MKYATTPPRNAHALASAINEITSKQGGKVIHIMELKNEDATKHSAFVALIEMNGDSNE